MKKFLTKKASKAQLIFVTITVVLLWIVIGCFAVTKYLLTSFAAEDYCSSQAAIASKTGQGFGITEVEECMDEYKQTY
jgi:hypothetical protein